MPSLPEEIIMSRFLIAGATGLIGKALLRELGRNTTSSCSAANRAIPLRDAPGCPPRSTRWTD